MIESFEHLRPAIDSMQEIDGPDYIVLNDYMVDAIAQQYLRSGSAVIWHLVNRHVLRGEELAEHGKRIVTPAWHDTMYSVVGSLVAAMRESNQGDRTFAVNAPQVPALIEALIYPEAADEAARRIVGTSEA